MPEGDEHAVSGDHAALEDGSGRDLSRILSLSDGIFGFAMTLMVLTLVVPAVPAGGGHFGSYLAYKLQLQEGAFEWYVLGFLLIAVWWMGHHALFSRIVRWTRALIGLNLAFLLTIAVTPYFIELLENYDGTKTATAAYAASQVVSSLCFGLLTVYATRVRGIMDDRVTPATRRVYEERALYRTAIFIAAFGIALVYPEYALFILLATLLVQARKSRRPAPASGSPPSAGPATAESTPGAPGAGAPLPPS